MNFWNSSDKSVADNEIIRVWNYTHSNLDLKIIPFDREKYSGFNHIRIISFTVTLKKGFGFFFVFWNLKKILKLPYLLGKFYLQMIL